MCIPPCYLFYFSSKYLKSRKITAATSKALSSLVASVGKIKEKQSASLIAAFKQPGVLFCNFPLAFPEWSLISKSMVWQGSQGN